MNSRELRIGNLLIDSQGRLCRVQEITSERFSAPAIIGPITTLPNRPLKLDEHWAIILGLRKEGEELKTTNWSGLFLKYNLQWFLMRRTNKGDVQICYGLQFVHELQNILFDLTKEELKFV